MSATPVVTSHEKYDDIALTRNAHIHAQTGQSSYVIKVLDGNIEITCNGYRLVIHPYEPNKVSINRSLAKYQGKS